MYKFFILASVLFLCATDVNAQDDLSPWYEQYEKITYSELRALIDNDKVEAARVLNDGWWVTIKTTDGEYFDTRITPQTPIADHLYEAGVPVSIEHSSVEEDDDTPLWLEVFYNLLPLLIFIVFFAFVMSVMNSKKKQDKFFERLEETIRRSVNND